MKATKYLGALAAIAMFAACSSEDELTGASDRTDEVKINATVGSGSIFSRTNPVGTQEEQTQFNTGDKISVSDGTNTVVYVKDTDGNWTSADGSFLKWESANMTFKAFYPALKLDEYEAYPLGKGVNSYDKGYVIHDQSNECIAQSDFMRAKVVPNEIPSNRKLNITMERMTARVIFNIVMYGDEFDKLNPTITEFKVHSYHEVPFPASTWNRYLSIDPYVKTVDEATSIVGKQYIALVSPESQENSSEKFISMTVKYDGCESEIGKSMSVKGIPALEAGKSYTYNLKVGKEKVTVENVTVSDWQTGAVIPGGEAEEVKATDASTLTNLISKAQDNTETVIKLGESFSVSHATDYKAFNIPAGKNITIDGGGKTITVSGIYVDCLFDVSGTLTLKNVKLGKTETKSANVGVNSGAKVTLEDATVEGSVNVFGGTLSLEKGSTVMSDNYPLNIQDGGIVTFNGGIVSGTDYEILFRGERVAVDYVPLVCNAKPTAENTPLRLSVSIDNSITTVATLNYVGAKANDFSLYRWWNLSTLKEITGGTFSLDSNALKLVLPAGE